MRDSALKLSSWPVTVDGTSLVGEELMRDSALKPIPADELAACLESEKSSCATAL